MSIKVDGHELVKVTDIVDAIDNRIDVVASFDKLAAPGFKAAVGRYIHETLLIQSMFTGRQIALRNALEFAVALDVRRTSDGRWYGVDKEGVTWEPPEDVSFVLDEMYPHQPPAEAPRIIQ